MDFDYKALGLKCGLECHQQLGTGKLFSRAPSILRDDEPHFKVKRRLRSVVSELGEHDRAALEASQKGLYYIYAGYNDTISLVELDEEPPQPIDSEALRAILEVAMLCKSHIIDRMFVMRKTVVDGSNTSGFQRTMLVATGGKISLRNKELGVQTIVLEEDAARSIEKHDDRIVYNLDRLGIPLIELATEPGIETPEEAKEAARAIGNVFRLTGKVKRGLGTIRQDLNISIRGGSRTEIKGVQDLDIIDEYVRREVQRQHSMLAVKEELAKRGAKKNEIAAQPKDLSRVFAQTEAKIIRNSLAKGDCVLGLRLEKFGGVLGKELQPGRRLGTEFADHVKTKAGLKGLFHSDELPNYGITPQEVVQAETELGCSKQDAFIIVAGPREKAEKAVTAVIQRAQQCLEGIPEETRGALEGGNTEYLRPLPGAARMYPETDLESVTIGEKELAQIRGNLPRSLGERLALYRKWGLNNKHSEEMVLSNHARLFELAVQKGADPKKTAVLLLEAIVEARRGGAAVENLGQNALEEFIDALRLGKITKEIQVEMLVEKSKNPGLGIERILEKTGAGKSAAGEIDKVAKEIINKNIGMVREKGLGALGPLMGDAMEQLRGRATGKEISEALKKEIQKAVK